MASRLEFCPFYHSDRELRVMSASLRVEDTTSKGAVATPIDKASHSTSTADDKK